MSQNAALSDALHEWRKNLAAFFQLLQLYIKDNENGQMTTRLRDTLLLRLHVHVFDFLFINIFFSCVVSISERN